MRKKKISIVIPCFNEQESIPLFYKEINKVSKKMSEVNFEFLFINDGSKDKTLNVLKKLSSKDKRVRYISFSRNFGKESGILAGLKNITGDYAAIMDVDLQDPPYLLEKMYEIIKNEDYDIVALKTINHKDYSFFRNLLTKLFYKLIAKFSSVEQVAGARDFRLMKREVVDSIISFPEYNRYIKGIFSYVGFNTKWLEYEAPDRAVGNSSWGLKKLFKYALEGIFSFSTKPLVIAAFLGLFFCFVAFFFLLVIIFKTLAFGDPVSGWPSLACIIVFVSGIQLFFMGIFGIYLSKVYLEVKRRPLYIISETEKDNKK